MRAFEPKLLPLKKEDLNPLVFMESLVDAVESLAIYHLKLQLSKLSLYWFLPTLQQKEAMASAKLEGTQVTLDGVLEDQINPSGKDKDLTEVRNYYMAARQGEEHLKSIPMSKELIKSLHKTLLSGNVRRNAKTVPGEFRTSQNYIGKENNIIYVPPVPESIDGLMNNFVEYFNDTEDTTRPLVKAAIMHAQFETVHPFDDGNGRVGRILIPLYLYMHKQVPSPYFFISEALERNKYLYYDLLNGVREKNDWDSWIDYFLKAVRQQCEKNIELVDKINELYVVDLEKARAFINSSKVEKLINLLYSYPVINSHIVARELDISSATVTRYLNLLVENKILYVNNKQRNKVYYYYRLLDILSK
jgi:Fic family protein